MISKYDEFIIQETLSEYLPLNEKTQMPAKVQNFASSVALKFTEEKNDLASKIKEKYDGKSFKEILQITHKEVKDSAVGEFASEVGKGSWEKMKPTLKWLSKKVGEYSLIGLVIVSILDYVIPSWIMENWFNVIEWKLGIAIFVSLIIYILTKKKSK